MHARSIYPVEDLFWSSMRDRSRLCHNFPVLGVSMSDAVGGWPNLGRLCHRRVWRCVLLPAKKRSLLLRPRRHHLPQ